MKIGSYLPTNLYSFVNFKAPLDKCVSSKTLHRIVGIALPLLNFYQPAATISSVGTSAIKGWSHVVEIKNGVEERDFAQAGRALAQLALTVAMVASSIFRYRTGLIVCISYELIQDIFTISQCLWRGEYKEAAYASLQASQHAFYLASIVAPSPYLLIISYTAQIALNAYQAYGKYQSQNQDALGKLECLSHLIVSGLYAIQLGQQVQLIKAERSFAKVNLPQSINNQQLKGLLVDFQAYKEARPGQPVQFAHFLKAKGVSNHLLGIDFSNFLRMEAESGLDKDLFQNVNFDGVAFSDCLFRGVNLSSSFFGSRKIVSSDFTGANLSRASFKNVFIQRCLFNGANLSLASFWNVVIQNSEFKSAELRDLMASNLSFVDSQLKRAYFDSSTLHNVSFNNCGLKESIFDDSRLNNCEFIGSDLSGADLIGATLDSCQFKHVIGVNANCFKSKWTDCVVSHTNWTDSLFNYASFQSVQLEQTNLEYVNFQDSRFDKSLIKKCNLTGTNFLDVKARSSFIKDSNLTNCLLFEAAQAFHFSNCTENIIKHPIIGLSTNLAVRGVTVPEAYRSIKAGGAIPIKFDSVPDDIDVKRLQLEIENALQELKQADNRSSFYSLPDELLKRAAEGSEMMKIKKRAYRLMSYADAIVVPGGCDIEPEFYGHERQADTETNDDYQRTLFELALFQINHLLDVPILGICRGAQIGAIFHGAYLDQHVENQIGLQEYKVTGGVLKELVGETITGLSMHHQAIKNPNDNLKVTASKRLIIKALEHISKPLLLFQFHIEYAYSEHASSLLSPNTAFIFPYFSKLADVYRLSKQKILEINVQNIPDGLK